MNRAIPIAAIESRERRARVLNILAFLQEGMLTPFHAVYAFENVFGEVAEHMKKNNHLYTGRR